jgi:hypothetical protein
MHASPTGVAVMARAAIRTAMPTDPELALKAEMPDTRIEQCG